MFIRQGFVTNSSSTSYYFYRYQGNTTLDDQFFRDIGLEYEGGEDDGYEREPEEIFQYIRDNVRKVTKEEVDKIFRETVEWVLEDFRREDLSGIYASICAEHMLAYANLKHVIDSDMEVFYIEAVSDGDDPVSRDLRCGSQESFGDTNYEEGFLTINNS